MPLLKIITYVTYAGMSSLSFYEMCMTRIRMWDVMIIYEESISLDTLCLNYAPMRKIHTQNIDSENDTFIHATYAKIILFPCKWNGVKIFISILDWNIDVVQYISTDYQSNAKFETCIIFACFVIFIKIFHPYVSPPPQETMICIRPWIS
jgi:hypothetical protein